MKNTITRVLLLLLTLTMLLSLVACADVEKTGAWENATYDKDKTFGNGAITIEVEVIAEEQSITFTIKTDKKILADALLEHDLVSGEDSTYGLYILTVNGIVADWDEDQTYWALTKDGESTLGASAVEIADGDHYELTKTKG